MSVLDERKTGKLRGWCWYCNRQWYIRKNGTLPAHSDLGRRTEFDRYRRRCKGSGTTPSDRLNGGTEPDKRKNHEEK